MTEARRVAGAFVACLAGLALVSCGDQDDVVVGAAGASLEGEQSLLQLPHGRLTFEVTDAEEIPDGAASDAPSDGRFVGVDWSWEPGAGVPSLVSGFLIADDVPADVRVQVDGAWHDLGSAYDTSAGGVAGATFFVPASDDVVAADVTVAVDFDGVEQTVQGDGSGLEAGAAAPMYEITGEPTTPECPAVLSPATAVGGATCEAAFVELPYVTDLGWAASGTTWVVADLSVTVGEVTVGGEDQPVVEQTETISLDGTEPEAVLLDENGSGGVLRTQSVFASEVGAARRLSYSRSLTTAQGPGVAEVTGELTAPAP